MITRRGLHKASLATWIIAGVPFTVFCFTIGIVPGVLAIAIICGGTMLSMKKFPLPKE